MFRIFSRLGNFHSLFRYRLALISVACLSPGIDTMEPQSKLRFPGRLTFNFGSNLQREQFLIGVGLRKVTIFGIHAYAAGIYIDELSMNNTNSLESLLDSNTSYTIRIVASRDSSLSHMRGAMGRNLENALKKEHHNGNADKLKQEIRQFLGCFPTAKIKMGESVLIHKSNDGTVYIQREGSELCGVSSEWIGRVILSSYLDPKLSTIPALPKDVQDSFSRLLVSSQ